MFDEYKKKIEAIGENAPKVFKKVAQLGAVKFRNAAVTRTDQERLVDTGNYRRNWNGEAIEFEGDYGIVCQNNVEYASFLEEGHRMRNGRRWKGRFVGRMAREETRYYCYVKLDEMFQKLYAKYQRGFTTPDS